MEKERRELTKREKVMVGLGVVTTVASIGLGIKYRGVLKRTKVLEKVACESRDRLDFVEVMVIEGDILQTSIQNISNKIARCVNKMGVLEERVSVRGDYTVTDALERLTEEYLVLTNCLDKANKLNDLILEDKPIYKL